MTTALLIGTQPPLSDFRFVSDAPYEAVVIGSLSINELLFFRHEQVLQALSQGKSVYLYTPGLPEITKNRALSAAACSAQRQLKNWGVLFTDGARRHIVTADEARRMRQQGQRPTAGAVLTPLAKEIMEGLN